MTKTNKNQLSWSDWFGRSEDDEYTFRDNTNKAFNWERGYDNYSNFLMRDSGSVKEAATLVGSMLSVMGVERKQKITSSYTKAATELAGANPVILPVDILSNKKYAGSSTAERTDAFLGGSVRNAASKVFNRAGHANELLQTRVKLRDAKDTDAGYSVMERLRDMFGLALNDERTDRKVAEESPGYTNFIAKYKGFKFKHHYEAKTYDNDYQEFADVLLRMIQHPGSIDAEQLEKYKPYLKQVEKIMEERGGIPSTFQGCKALSEELAQFVYRMIVDPPPPPDGGGEGEGEGEGGDGPGEGSSGGGSGTPPPPMSPAEIEAAMESLKKMISGNGVSMVSDVDGNDDSLKMEQILDELTGMGMYDEMEYPEKINIKMVKGNRGEYDRVLKELDTVKASVIGTLLRRKARDFKFSIKSTRSGRLDTNKLVEAKMKVPTVYERIGEVKTDKLSVCILIDESGSMSGTKIKKAREAAIFLNEALKRQPDIKLFIYGHTADDDTRGDTDITVYREPGHHAPYALSEVSAKSNNRDGTAILTCAKRVRKHTQDPVVFIVISDGYPAASGYRSLEHGCEHTAKCVKRVEGTMNMQVIQIAIESMNSAKMFKNFIHLTDLNTFPTEFVGFLKRKMNSMIKEHVTM